MSVTAGADPTAATTGTPTSSIIVFGALAVLMWISWVNFVHPAVRSQAGRPDRMSRDKRIRRIAEATFWVIYPLIVTVALMTMLFANGSGGSTGGMWPTTMLGWAVFAMPLVAAAVWFVALIVRCLDRHQMRLRHRALGLPDPRPPWWPGAVVAVWTIGVLTIFVGASVAMWMILMSLFEGRVVVLQEAVRAASLDPSVQQLVTAGASRTTIDARLEQLTPGARGQLTDFEHRFMTVATGNVIAFFAILVVIAIGGIVLYRRQKRRRAEYDQRIVESVTRAAALSL